MSSEQIFPGVYRGVVEDTNDPEQRKRYRVRVFTLHPDSIPSGNLPWAESALFAGKMFGDLSGFELGDPVFVMFEGGNRRFPVVVGGSMSASGGIPDAPAEVRGNYPETQKRWVRLDRVGNLIEMSPIPEERWIRIQSGEAVIALRMNDGSVEIRSNSQVQVTAPQVAVDATEQVTVKTKTLIAQVDETATIRSADVVNVQGATKINIGRYEDPILGPVLPQTTDEVDIRANNNIKAESGGTIDVDATSNITVDTQATFALEAQTEVQIHGVSKTTVSSDGDVEVNSEANVKVNAAQNVEVNADQKVVIGAATTVEITGQQGVTIKAAASNLTIQAEAGNMTIEAQGNVNVTASAAATIESTGPLTLKSNVQVKLEAPLIDMTAQTKATVDGGALAEIKGGLVNIG
jgi:uncharacterized protein (DUF2345 family)